MTVIELRDALSALIEQGHGELPVGYRYDINGCGILAYDTVDRVFFEENGDDAVPGPLIELE